MSFQGQHLYWDTCVFIAHLGNQTNAYGKLIDHIEQYLDEARSGQYRIYTSTITIAEITQKHLAGASHPSFNDFLLAYKGTVIPIAADPNIMLLASHLRGMTYRKTGGERWLLTPDAIHIATAIFLSKTYKVPLDVFHTFDAGKQKSAAGKGVPIIGYEDWTEECKNDPQVQSVISLKRERPHHPSPRLHK